MIEINEGGLTFVFPEPCEAAKYDGWEFYQKRFQSTAGVSKAVDMVCVTGRSAWLIEVKDYRVHPRTKPIDLADEVAQKVRDTLAGLAAASANAEEVAEKALAALAVEKQSWRVALHLEQPDPTGSRLRPHAINKADVLQTLRRKLKAVDAQPVVADRQASRAGLPWTVR